MIKAARAFKPAVSSAWWQAYGAAATWNPSRKGSQMTLSNGNLDATSGNGWTSVAASAAAPSSVKSYMEITVITSGSDGYGMVGCGDGSFSVDSFLGDTAVSGGATVSGAAVYSNGFNWDFTPNATMPTSTVIGLLFDTINNRLYMSRNGVWLNSANPQSDTGYVAHGLPASVYAAVAMYQSFKYRANFGASAFSYPPS